MRNGIRAQNGSLTIVHRRDVRFSNGTEKQRAAHAARSFLADEFTWLHDAEFIAKLSHLLRLDETDRDNLRWKIERAIDSGELVTVPDAPPVAMSVHTSGSGAGEAARPSARGFALTPSQAFGRAAGVVAAVRSFAPPTLPRLPANDFAAIMAANPGDILPDGRIATALNNAQPFEYMPDVPTDDVLDLAASTNNPRFAAKTLGYDESTFSEMLHVFKPANGLRPSDNVIFHDDGSVEFGKQILDDNIHNYAP
ncbi:hypothetical protein [Caballeronia grimmiae]|uniref:hypothetical protein n=1 Tax=Caballeronia grimmiae TaxID=1071679 RepID=UPI0038B9A04A